MSVFDSVSVAQLLARGPESCQAFIREHFPAKFAWVHLAEGASTKADALTVLGERQQESGLEWLRVAVELYERIADHNNASPQSRIRFTEPAIAMRVRAIDIWGADDDDGIRSPKELTARFLSVVKESPKAMETVASDRYDEDMRTAILLTRFVEPLLERGDLKPKLRELSQYCQAARNAEKAILVREKS